MRQLRLLTGSPPRIPSCIVSLGTFMWLAGCTSTEVMVAHSVDLQPSTETIAEEQLLDVGVVVFDPGVPAGEVDKEVLEELIRDGTFVQIRRTESMYMAVQMQDTLQNSGHWGAVWVTPTASNAADLNVAAEILHSDGDIVRVQVDAVDATGRVWIDDEYELETAAGSYNRQRYPELDPYQDLFNSIANDLAAVQAELTAEETGRIRTVAALRYAEELSPDAFAGYVEEDGDGTYELNRLPAESDPMFDRTQQVRQRERLFIETLNQHYSEFSREAMPSYDGWRQYAREEAISIRELTKSARWRTGIGIATIVASVVYGSNSNNNGFSDRVVRDALMYMGMDVLRTGAVRRQEKRLHSETLEELSESFNDEVQPLVVEIQGTQHRLAGTAEVQYQEWRDLLQRMFVNETGFAPVEISIYEAPEEELVPGRELAPDVIETGAGADLGPATDSSAAAGSATATGSGAAPGSATATGSGAVTGGPAAIGGATATGGGPNSDDAAEPRAETESDLEAPAGTQTETAPETETGTEPGPGPAPEAQPAAETDSQLRAAPEPEEARSADVEGVAADTSGGSPNGA